jgi:hypothetical protein
MVVAPQKCLLLGATILKNTRKDNAEIEILLYWEGKLKGENKMLLNEVMRVDYASIMYANYAPKKLMSQIEFRADGNKN